MKFFQFIGTQRSGSNLLRLMLNQLEGIYAPHPPHILKTFYPLIPNYGNLNSGNNFETLIDDVLSWIKINPIKWKSIPSKNQIIKRSESKSLFQIFKSVYEINAELDSRVSCWCCKSLYNLNFYKNENFKNLKPIYIYIYRDGRDVSSSFMKAPIGDKHIYFLSKKWNKDQMISLKIQEITSKNNFFPVKYEDLLSNPKLILKSFCDKYLIDYNDNFLDFYKSDDSISASSSGKLWKNLSRPLIKNNKEKYFNELTNNDILLFESINHLFLKSLGYKLNFKEKLHVTSFSKDDIENFKVLNNKLKDKLLKNISSKEILNREMQLKLLRQLKN
tara:strand:- start:55212 stop:56207 length:996 start_codon:yes stop_codon:yes gene_type:complete